ncbi:MAG: hypothetical protein HY040_05215 [Planctomycetes bacterium]|nr:hypothetical protein [Planctomycetota bacterium]
MIDWRTLEPTCITRSVKLQPIDRLVWAAIFAVKTTIGTDLELWRILEGESYERFNCHGFTLRTQDAPQGPFWVQWSEMFKVLIDGYVGLESAVEVLPGDVIVWGNENRIEHSALVRTPVYHADGITEETRVDGKNGTRPPDMDVPLSEFQGEFRGCRRMFFRSRGYEAGCRAVE